MSEKISPQQAFEAAKVLWPELKSIDKDHLGNHLFVGTIVACEIDWPSGVTQWPMPEPKWRDARMPEDYGKEAKFSDDDDDYFGRLCGLADETEEYKWIDQSGYRWKFCQVRDEPKPTFAETVATLKTIKAPATIYRLLEPHETIREGDELTCSYQGSPNADAGWISVLRGRNPVGGKPNSGAAVRRPILTERDGVNAGEGYRLLDREEKVIEGDELLVAKKWTPTINHRANDGNQCTSAAYRRKLEVPS